MAASYVEIFSVGCYLLRLLQREFTDTVARACSACAEAACASCQDNCSGSSTASVVKTVYSEGGTFVFQVLHRWRPSPSQRQWLAVQAGNWSVLCCVQPEHGQVSLDTILHPPWLGSWGLDPQAWQRGQVCAHSRAWGVGWTLTAGHQRKTALTVCSGSIGIAKTQHAARKGWEPCTAWHPQPERS